MGRDLSRSVVGLIFLLSAAAPMDSAGAAANDPFAALQITRLAPASSVADFDLKSLAGRSLRSQDLVGTVVLLNFWATWCGPCKEEMPSLAVLQDRFDPREVRVVTVTADMNAQAIKQFLDYLGIRLPVLFDEDQKLSRSFMVRGLPTTVLIAQDGHAVGRAIGPRSWDSAQSIDLVRHMLAGMK